MPNAPSIEPIGIHEIEPALRGPVPRRIRVSPAIGALFFCVGLFWLAGVAIALSALSEFTKLVWLRYAGHPAMAQIREVVFEDGRRGSPASEPLIHVAGVIYVYRRADGIEQQGTSAVSPPDPGRGFSSFAEPYPARSQELQARRLTQIQRLVQSGRPWRVRYASWFGRTICEPWVRPPLGKMLFLATIGFFVLGCATFFALRFVRWLKMRAHLLRRGIATIGTILHTRTDADDSPKFFVRYGYAVAGAAFDREEQCSPEQWRCLHVGESVTVLCDPDRPNVAVLYRLLPFGQ